MPVTVRHLPSTGNRLPVARRASPPPAVRRSRCPSARRRSDAGAGGLPETSWRPRRGVMLRQDWRVRGRTALRVEVLGRSLLRWFLPGDPEVDEQRQVRLQVGLLDAGPGETFWWAATAASMATSEPATAGALTCLSTLPLL